MNIFRKKLPEYEIRMSRHIVPSGELYSFYGLIKYLSDLDDKYTFFICQYGCEYRIYRYDEEEDDSMLICSITCREDFV